MVIRLGPEIAAIVQFGIEQNFKHYAFCQFLLRLVYPEAVGLQWKRQRGSWLV